MTLNRIRDIIFSGPMSYNPKRDISKFYQATEVIELTSANVQIYGTYDMQGQDFVSKMASFLVGLERNTSKQKCVIFTGHNYTFSLYMKQSVIFLCDTHKVVNKETGILAQFVRNDGSLEEICEGVAEFVLERLRNSVGERVFTEYTQLLLIGRKEVPELSNFTMDGYMAEQVIAPGIVDDSRTQ